MKSWGKTETVIRRPTWNRNKKQDGYTQTFKVYGCADCSGCEHIAKCLYKYNAEKDAEKNKVMKVNERWEELKEESHTNIQSKKGDTKPPEPFHSDNRVLWGHKEKLKIPSFNYHSTQ